MNTRLLPAVIGSAIPVGSLRLVSAAKFLRRFVQLQIARRRNHQSRCRSPTEAKSLFPSPPPGQSFVLPAYCRVEGVINRRKGVGGEEFGIQFVLAMPDQWNGDFLMQGGAGGNGILYPPIGQTAAGDKPALMRGYAVRRHGHRPQES